MGTPTTYNRNRKLSLAFGRTCLLMLGLFTLPGETAKAQNQNGMAQQLQQMKTEMERLSRQLDERKIGGFQLEQQRKIESQLSLLVRQFSSGQQSGETTNDSSSEKQSAESAEQGTGGVEPQSDAAVQEESTTVGAQRESVLKAWGLLPENLERESNSGIAPRFLPGYERAIQEYYKRIAR